MRGKTPSPSNTTSNPVVPLPDLLAQKPVEVALPEKQEMLADEVVNAVQASLESTAATKKSKTKLPSCLTEPEQSAEERKKSVLEAAKPNEDDLMELLLSKKSKVQAMQRSASQDEGGDGKSRPEISESSPIVESSPEVRTEKEMPKQEKTSEKALVEKEVTKKTDVLGKKMEKTSKAVERQPSKTSDSFSKALGENDKIVSKKKAKKDKKSDDNEKHKKGTKERVYIDTEKARSLNHGSRNETGSEKTATEKSQKHKKVEKHKEAENMSKGEKSSKDSLLAGGELVGKESSNSSSVGTPLEEDDMDSDNIIGCQYCFELFKFKDLQEHTGKCEKKFETIEILAGQVEPVEGVGGRNDENLKKKKDAVVHSDDEPADEFAREGRERGKENEVNVKEGREAREKETMEQEVGDDEEKERRKVERKLSVDEKEKTKKEEEREKKKKGTEKEMRRRERKRKENEEEQKGKDKETKKKESQQQENNEKDEDREEEDVGETKDTGKTPDDITEGERMTTGGDAPAQDIPQQKDSSKDEDIQPTKRIGGDIRERNRPTKRRRIVESQVMSLHKALGGESASEEDEVEEEPLSIWKGGI